MKKQIKSKKQLSKKAEGIMSLSFGTIFSIFLIIFFVVVAFIAIRHFLSVQSCAKVGLFLSDIQDEVDQAWGANDQTVEFKGNLPSGIKKVCFFNSSDSFSGPDKELGIELDILEDKNMIFMPMQKACDMPDNKIQNIDVNWITRTNNPYCIDVKNGQISFIVEKGNNDRLVKIRK